MVNGLSTVKLFRSKITRGHECPGTHSVQLLAYYLGVLRDCDVDQPRNLANSVTVE